MYEHLPIEEQPILPGKKYMEIENFKLFSQSSPDSSKEIAKKNHKFVMSKISPEGKKPIGVSGKKNVGNPDE